MSKQAGDDSVGSKRTGGSAGGAVVRLVTPAARKPGSAKSTSAAPDTPGAGAQRFAAALAGLELNHHLLDELKAASRSAGGQPDLAHLLRSISRRYDAIEEERRGIVRSMQLMSDEAQALTREIREQSAAHLQVILDHIKDAVITVNETGHIETFNPTGERIFGYTQPEVLGRTLDYLVLDAAAAKGGVVVWLERLAARAEDTQADLASSETWGRNKQGQRFAAEIAVSQAQVERRRVYIVCLRDVTERRQAEQTRCENEARYRELAEKLSEEKKRVQSTLRALSYQASHDALTGLINRREFESRLNQALAGVRRGDELSYMLLYLDLDQFKLVNDTCGHPAGDRLLKQVTGLLQTRIRGTDTLARLGGDEFGILLADCSHEQAMKIAETLCQAIRDYRFVWHDGALNIGVSIGLVAITREAESMAALMSAADVACYAAKDQGRNRVHVYQPDNVPERHREMQWVSRITRACEEDRLELYFQPIVPIGANRDPRPHYELVLRMRDESGELVLPNAFIPAAERYNVMPMIDRWVVRQALASLAHHTLDQDPPYTLSVNLSGTSLNDDRFLEFLISELAAHPLSPGAICFEITETAAIYNLAKVVYFMRELKGRGCSFSLDDFGSGLSSFMYLKTLPVNYLKIDGQFIEHVADNPIDRSMVEAISQIGRAMGIQTIAEKVESAEVMAELGRLGIGYAQGFYIAPPQPMTRFPHPRRCREPERKLA
jgi:diguanylate cyclase (GGDEF)-like protein/PAS domain S-box-containing protein